MKLFKSQRKEGRIELEQQQYILMLLLRGSLVLSIAALLILLVAHAVTGNMQFAFTAVGASFVVAFCLVLYWLTIRGAVVVASFLFSLCYFALATMAIVVWGVMIPQGLLLFALAIISSSLLIGRRAGLLMFVLTCLSLGLVTYFTQAGVLAPQLNWMGKQGVWSDVIIFALTFLIMLITAWLSNREIERLLMRSHTAEMQLTKERDQLEETVKERTRELRQQQESEMMRLYEFAYFGRTTASFLHDMVSPVSTVAMTLRRVQGGESPELLQRAVANAERLEQYIAAARAQLHKEERLQEFSLIKEIRQVVDMLEDKAEQAGVSLEVLVPESAQLMGDPLKFYRLVANLVSNAIDACAGQPKDERRVMINLAAKHRGFILSVADTGSGISAEKLGQVFDPFFTSKAAGSGMGLAICKEIVEADFGGSLTVESTVGEGTTFAATLFSHAKKSAK